MDKQILKNESFKKFQKNHKIKISFKKPNFLAGKMVLLQIPICRQSTPPRWCLLVTANIFYNWQIGSGATFKTYHSHACIITSTNITYHIF